MTKLMPISDEVLGRIGSSSSNDFGEKSPSSFKNFVSKKPLQTGVKTSASQPFFPRYKQTGCLRVTYICWKYIFTLAVNFS